MSAIRRDAVRRLVVQTRRNLDMARLNRHTGGYEVAAFLANQAVELYLKAAWIHVLRREQPHTHALLKLTRPFDVPEGLGPKIAALNVDYTVARYPDAANGVPYELYDRCVADEKVAIAEEVFLWLDGLFDMPRRTKNGD